MEAFYTTYINGLSAGEWLLSNIIPIFVVAGACRVLTAALRPEV